MYSREKKEGCVVENGGGGVFCLERGVYDWGVRGTAVYGGKD